MTVVAASAASAQQKCPAVQKGAIMPLKYKGGPTVAAITACDLMTRLYIYADDSLRGREAGTPDAIRATDYIEKEVRRLKLKPAGDNGTYFMNMPVFGTVTDTASAMLMVGSSMFRLGSDFGINGAANVAATPVVFGGVQGDTANALTAAQVQGKIVVVKAAAQPAGGRGQGGAPGGGRGNAGRGAGGGGNPYAGAVAVLTVVGDALPTGGGFGGRGGIQPRLIDSVEINGGLAYAAANPNANAGRGGRGNGGGGGVMNATVTSKVAGAIFGKPLDQVAKGDAGAATSISVKQNQVPMPTRSVVAILPGSDPKLKNEYIVIGGHSDHVGAHGSGMIEHDSIKAYNMIARVEGADSRGAAPPTAEQWVRINAIKDSLRKIYPARPDSISNGADDDGSGSVSVLEIAEAFAKGKAKPKRSLIFIWQTGEEKGLWGSLYFTNHPTVPRESIVADLNIDMVGRGEATDVTGRSKDGKELTGGPNYLQLVGSRRLSTEYGDLAEAVNKTEKVPFVFDYSMDADGHPQNIYCRSDHYEYARYGIPVIFFTTGGHADYHQVTDEPQYIQYQHMARVDQLIFDIALKVGNAPNKPTVDKAKQDSPFGRCQQ